MLVLGVRVGKLILKIVRFFAKHITGRKEIDNW